MEICIPSQYRLQVIQYNQVQHNKQENKKARLEYKKNHLRKLWVSTQKIAFSQTT